MRVCVRRIAPPKNVHSSRRGGPPIPRNAAAYAAAERMNDALTKLAMADPRLKAMVDQAASAGATLPDDELDEPPAGKPPSIEITAAAFGRHEAAPHSAAFRLGREHRVAVPVRSGSARARRSRAARRNDGYRYAGARPTLRYQPRRHRTPRGHARRRHARISRRREHHRGALRRDARDVTLVQGRALFDAAHDAARPFVVTVGTERVTALGTVFQVDRAPSEVVVTLAQGAVTVTSQRAAEAVRLAPGEELRSSAGSTRWVKRTVDAQSATSWSLAAELRAALVLYPKHKAADGEQF